MSSAELKASILKLLDTMSRDKLESFYAMAKELVRTGSEEKELWDELSATEQQAIEEGLADIEAGNVRSHEAVMNKYKQRYGLA